MSFVLQVASAPDRDQLVKEVWWNDQLVAEIRLGANGKQFIDLYAMPSRIPWSFEFQEWLAVMNKANEI